MKITFQGRGIYGKDSIAGRLVALESRIESGGSLVFDVKLDGKDAGVIACGDTLEDPPESLDDAVLAAIEAQAAPRIARALVALTGEILAARESVRGGVVGSILGEEFPQ